MVIPNQQGLRAEGLLLGKPMMWFRKIQKEAGEKGKDPTGKKQKQKEKRCHQGSVLN